MALAYSGTGGGEFVKAVASLLEELYQGNVVDTADVARALGTHARSVIRWQADEAKPRRGSEERLLELRSVVNLLRRVMRSDPARLWLRSPNAELRYEKPIDLIAKGEYRRVVALLLTLAEGVTA